MVGSGNQFVESDATSGRSVKYDGENNMTKASRHVAWLGVCTLQYPRLLVSSDFFTFPRWWDIYSTPSLGDVSVLCHTSYTPCSSPRRRSVRLNHAIIFFHSRQHRWFVSQPRVSALPARIHLS